MRVVLVGQPNSGKSTIFNAVAGYRAATANFPGTSTSYISSRVLVGAQEIEVVDLPGAYSLTSQEPAERLTLDYLLTREPDVLINVVDSARLGRSLELTLQLLELRQPLVLALNMADEAHRKGVEVDAAALERELGVRVVVTIGRRGMGLVELFAAALDAAHAGHRAPCPRYDREIEAAVAETTTILAHAGVALGERPRLAALKLLERDPCTAAALAARASPDAGAAVEQVVQRLEGLHGWPGEQVISGARHALAHRIEDSVARLRPPHAGWREKLDLALMHPVLGIPLMISVLLLFCVAVFALGKHLEAPLVAAFERAAAALGGVVPPDSTFGAMLRGIVLGVSGGVAVVLPFLLPLLAGLAALEDTGYLPRMAYLLDGVMHRLGLHGKSIVPLMLGYGCSVPAVLSTRILESSRDRRITATLAVLAPCSARTTVILGLVGALLGIVPALVVYAVNVVVLAALGVVLQRTIKGASPGLVLEVPDLRAPSLKTISSRTWVSLKEFILVAGPVLIASSVVLGLLEISQLDRAINAALAPLTVTALGLPAAVGLTLVFGVLRKELALMMLMQALGTTQLAGALSPAQMIAFALFVAFYTPCVATLAALGRELGWRDAISIAVFCAGLAVVIAGAGRLVTALVY